MSDSVEQSDGLAEPYARLNSTDPDSPIQPVLSESGVLLCYGCRSRGRCRMGLQAEALSDNGVVISHIVCGRHEEGGPNVAHGGWTAGILDEMVGHALLLNDEFAVTGRLEVVFRKPMPVEVPLCGRAWIANRDGRKVTVAAEITLEHGGAVMASATATMVKRPADHFARHEKWMAEQLYESERAGDNEVS